MNAYGKKNKHKKHSETLIEHVSNETQGANQMFKTKYKCPVNILNMVKIKNKDPSDSDDSGLCF